MANIEDRIKHQASNGMLTKLRGTLSEYFLEKDRDEYIRAKKEEYRSLYPDTRLETDEEYNSRIANIENPTDDDMIRKLINITPEITFDEWCNNEKINQQFTPKDNYDADIDNWLLNSEDYKSYKKQKVNSEIEKSTVTISTGKTFDANTQAISNMMAGILASETLNETQSVWRLADNSEPIITIDELREAHALAIKKYATIKSIGG